MNIQRITPLTFTGFYRPHNVSRFLEKDKIQDPTPIVDEFVKTEESKPEV